MKESLKPFLTFQTSVYEETFFKGVYKLLPGHYFNYDINHETDHIISCRFMIQSRVLTERCKKGYAGQISMKPKILLFNINIFKQSSIIALCSELEMEAAPVPSSQMGNSIGNIFSQTAKGREPSLVFHDEMLVFCGLSSQQLDAFLASYRKKGIPPIPLKAVLTQYNAKWTPYRLCSELKKEHNAINNSTI